METTAKQEQQDEHAARRESQVIHVCKNAGVPNKADLLCVTGTSSTKLDMPIWHIKFPRATSAHSIAVSGCDGEFINIGAYP